MIKYFIIWLCHKSYKMYYDITVTWLSHEFLNWSRTVKDCWIYKVDLQTCSIYRMTIEITKIVEFPKIEHILDKSENLNIHCFSVGLWKIYEHPIFLFKANSEIFNFCEFVEIHFNKMIFSFDSSNGRLNKKLNYPPEELFREINENTWISMKIQGNLIVWKQKLQGSLEYYFTSTYPKTFSPNVGHNSRSHCHLISTTYEENHPIKIRQFLSPIYPQMG